MNAASSAVAGCVFTLFFTGLLLPALVFEPRRRFLCLSARYNLSEIVPRYASAALECDSFQFERVIGSCLEVVRRVLACLRKSCGEPAATARRGCDADPSASDKRFDKRLDVGRARHAQVSRAATPAIIDVGGTPVSSTGGTSTYSVLTARPSVAPSMASFTGVSDALARLGERPAAAAEKRAAAAAARAGAAATASGAASDRTDISPRLTNAVVNASAYFPLKSELSANTICSATD